MHIAFWVLALVSAASANSLLQTEYEWKYFDYLWKSEAQRNYYKKNGRYNISQMIPIDVERSRDGRTFVTIVKNVGVPATLSTISSVVGKSGHLLKPYPNWNYYETENLCDGILNVYRVAIDACNRLWVLDNGSIGMSNTCPAKLMVFDLETDEEISRHIIDSKIATGSNGKRLLISPIVESEAHCQSTTVYMSNVLGYALVIYRDGQIARLEGVPFAGQDKLANISIAGDQFYLDDGIIGMALSPKQANGRRTLYFRPLASKSLYAADTKDLKASFIRGHGLKQIRRADILPSQGVAMAVSSNGVLFYGLTKEISIGCYNTQKPMEAQNLGIALTDTNRLQFISGMKIVRNSCGKEYLLMMSDRFQKFILGITNYNEINYRILSAPVNEITRGTVCDPYGW